MKINLILAFLLIIGFGCIKIEKSSVLEEKAIVKQLVYLPDTSDTQLAPGIGMNGNVTFTIISSGHKEFWAVVFQCYKHNNVFTLQGKDIYQKVNVGQVVDLKYVELYKIKNNEKIIVDYKTLEVITR